MVKKDQRKKKEKTKRKEEEKIFKNEKNLISSLFFNIKINIKMYVNFQNFLRN